MQRKKPTGAFIASVILHLTVVALVLFFTVYRPERKPKRAVFEMVSLPDSERGPTAVPPPHVEFEPPKAEPLPPEKPAPEPPPQVVPEPVPEPPKVEPKPQPKAEKKPEAKPEPKPEKKPEPPKQISYEEFLKEHGKPKPQTTKRPPKPINVPKIDTASIRRHLDQFIATSSEADRIRAMSDAEQSALENYFARIREAVKLAWNKPAGVGSDRECQVEFNVTSGGLLVGARIIRSSGEASMDQSVLQAFRDVNGVGPSPDGRSYPLRLTFRMVE